MTSNFSAKIVPTGDFNLLPQEVFSHAGSAFQYNTARLVMKDDAKRAYTQVNLDEKD